MKKLQNGAELALRGILLAVFLPVLVCVVWIGNGMGYWDGMKMDVLLPNRVLFVAALAGMGVCVLLCRKSRGMHLSGGDNAAVNGLLILLFAVLCFVNWVVVGKIAFELPWDIMMVRSVAEKFALGEELGSYNYLSIYPNNIPISYILGRLCRKAVRAGDFFAGEMVWIRLSCVLVSIGGYFSCLTVKKLTGNLAAVITAFLLYLALAGISPWKIAPYTDIYGMVFPVMCVYFYLCYRMHGKDFFRFLYLALSLVCVMAGGLIKPSVYVVLIALMGIELLALLGNFRKQWKFMVADVLIVAALACGGGAARDFMIRELGLQYNSELGASWQTYLYMGQNEGTTGGYNSEDVAIIGEFQFSRKERNQAALEGALQRMEDRGFWGCLYFWLKKMVMVFNDGAFGWRTEVWVYGGIPEEAGGSQELTEWLRDVFWPGGGRVGRYNTFCQLAWIFCMLGITGICVKRTEGEREYGILALSFLGIFFYQMLFEARARYLLVFLPLLTAVSVCGIWRYAAGGSALWELVGMRARARKGNKNEKQEEQHGTTGSGAEK